jgi:hypothetical protein
MRRCGFVAPWRETFLRAQRLRSGRNVDPDKCSKRTAFIELQKI